MKRFKNILYVADSSGVVLRAFHHAVGLAERNQAKLTVVVVMEPIPPYLTRLTPHILRQNEMKDLKAALDRLSEWSAGRAEIETKIIEGKPFLEIIRDVQRHDRDLVIKSVGNDGGTMDWLFGSTDMHLLRKCPCPVWLIKSTDVTPVQRVMACVDDNDLDLPDQDTADDLNRTILEMAASLSSLERSELHVVHAWEAVGEDAMLYGRSGIAKEEVDSYVNEVRLAHDRWFDKLMHNARAWIGPEAYDAINPKPHVVKGMAGDIIPTLSHDLSIDLVVMGTVARTGVSGLIIGNTAESILSKIDCSVLAIKPPGFVSPVKREDEN